jgi:hypothetical protein
MPKQPPIVQERDSFGLGLDEMSSCDVDVEDDNEGAFSVSM